MARKILFRADAKPEIGTGDLMSLYQLSLYLKAEGWKCYFMIRDYPVGVALLKKYVEQNLTIIDARISVDEEQHAINQLIKAEDIDVLMLEITERPLSLYDALDAKVKKACVCFDGHLPEGMNLVINWDVDAFQFFNIEAHPRTQFLLGPEYVILPFSFDQKLIEEREYSAEPKKVIIAMGGADEHDLTSKVVKAIVNNASGVYELHVVIGSGYRFRKKLEELLEQSQTQYAISQNLSNMFEAYMRCDVAVGAGGLTSSELIASRTPALLIAAYEHQRARCEFFGAKGWARYLGYRDFAPGELIEALNSPPIPSKKKLFQTDRLIEAVKAL